MNELVPPINRLMSVKSHLAARSDNAHETLKHIVFKLKIFKIFFFKTFEIRYLKYLKWKALVILKFP